MALEIFPQIATVYPGDRQVFTVRAPAKPAMWKVVTDTFGIVGPDFSVNITRPGQTTILAQTAQHLIGGVGSIEWVLTGQSVPLSPTQFRLDLFMRRPITGGFFSVTVVLRAADVRIDTEVGADQAIIPIPPAVGMRLKVEIANGFRLFIDGILRYSRTTFSELIAYPCLYIASFSQGTIQVQTNPAKVPPMLLEGDWQLKPLDTGSAPMVAFAVDHGSLASSGSALQQVYSGGTVPGTYKLRADISVGLNNWVEDGDLAGATVTSSGGVWVWTTTNPTPFTGLNRLKAPSAAGDHFYSMLGTTDTLQINKDDVMVVYVFLDVATPPTEIMVEWRATDSTSLEHRAYWGANSIALGTNGTPSRWNMGALPATNQWVRLEVPASVVNLEGRVLDGIKFRLFDGVCSFDHTGKFPGNLEHGEALITIPPLQILGDLVRTVQPGQKVRIQTNYDVAQAQPAVIWSVLSGGGSFSEGEFTATFSPGTSVLRAAASTGNQAADLTVIVPPVITPSFAFAGPLEEIDWNINVPTLVDFVAAGTMAEGTGNIIPGLPAGLQDKDIMLLKVETAAQAVTAPVGGWVAVADSPQTTGSAGAAGAVRLSVFWKRATAIETAPTVLDPGDHQIGQIFAFRGCIDTGNPWDVTAGNVEAAPTTSVSIPGDTTLVPNTLIVQIVANATDTASPQTSGYINTDLTELTERGDVNTTQGVGGGFAVVTGRKAVAGAFGTTTATLATASAQARISIALKPNVVVWTASAGSMNASTGLWTAPSLTGQTAKITATDGVFTVTRDVLIIPKFPFSNFFLPINRDRNLTALISMSEDRTSRITREKAPAYDSYEVKLVARHLDDVEAVDAFFDAQGFGKPFILEDLNRGVRKVGWFDSPIRHESRDECDNDLSFRFLEARL